MQAGWAGLLHACSSRGRWGEAGLVRSRGRVGWMGRGGELLSVSLWDGWWGSLLCWGWEVVVRGGRRDFTHLQFHTSRLAALPNNLGTWNTRQRPSLLLYNLGCGGRGEDGLHGSQRGLLIKQLLDVGPCGALGLCDGAAFLQGPRGIVQLLPEGLQVPVTLMAVGVGDEGQQLGGAEGTGGALCLPLLALGRGDMGGPVVHLRGLVWGVSLLAVRIFWVLGASAGDHRLTVHFRHKERQK